MESVEQKAEKISIDRQEYKELLAVKEQVQSQARNETKIGHKENEKLPGSKQQAQNEATIEHKLMALKQEARSKAQGEISIDSKENDKLIALKQEAQSQAQNEASIDHEEFDKLSALNQQAQNEINSKENEKLPGINQQTQSKAQNQITIDRKEYDELLAFKEEARVEATINLRLLTRIEDLEAKIGIIQAEKASYMHHLKEAKKELQEQKNENANSELIMTSLCSTNEDQGYKIADFAEFLAGCTTSRAKYEFFMRAHGIKNKSKRPVQPIHLERDRSYDLSVEITKLRHRGITIDENKVLKITPRRGVSLCKSDASGDSDETLVSSGSGCHLGGDDVVASSSSTADGTSKMFARDLGAGDAKDLPRQLPNASKYNESYPSSRRTSNSAIKRPETPARGAKRPPFVLPPNVENGSSSSSSSADGKQNRLNSEAFKVFPASFGLKRPQTPARGAKRPPFILPSSEISMVSSSSAGPSRPMTPAKGSKRPPFVLPPPSSSPSPSTNENCFGVVDEESKEEMPIENDDSGMGMSDVHMNEFDSLSSGENDIEVRAEELPAEELQNEPPLEHENESENEELPAVELPNEQPGMRLEQENEVEAEANVVEELQNEQPEPRLEHEIEVEPEGHPVEELPNEQPEPRAFVIRVNRKKKIRFCKWLSCFGCC